ncbi:MAG: CBS domain-containing protein, partial [Candidatus Competibacterales bacterium]|nr:CBS domain-containing protein [Candidatus Competibacterales bacterium]
GILDAIHLLLKNRISGAPVVDKLGNIVGILSEKDCLKVMLTASYYEEPGGKVEEFMTPEVKTVDAESSLVDVAEIFLETNYRRFPVVADGNRLVGQISRRDVLRALERLW